VCVASSCSATMCLWCSETMCVCGEVEGLLWVERRKEGSKEEAKGCCIVCVWGLVSFMNVGFFSGFYLWCSQSGDHSTKLFNLAKFLGYILDIKLRKHLEKKTKYRILLYFWLPTYLLLTGTYHENLSIWIGFWSFFPKIWQICVFFFQWEKNFYNFY
jgi:hypothetical protein